MSSPVWFFSFLTNSSKTERLKHSTTFVVSETPRLPASFFQHPFYPYSGTANPAPNMINVPLAEGSGGDAAKQAIEAQWLPALENFKPEMILISAGFDAHREDLLGGMALVEADYAWITREMMALAARHSQQRIVSMLEGGYNLSALGRSAVAHVKTLTEH